MKKKGRKREEGLGERSGQRGWKGDKTEENGGGDEEWETTAEAPCA